MIAGAGLLATRCHGRDVPSRVSQLVKLAMGRIVEIVRFQAQQVLDT